MAIRPKPPLAPTPVDARARRAQAWIGIGLFALVLGAWLTVHAWAMFSLTVSARSWPLVVPVVALQCWLSVGLFIVAHDAMHGSLAPGWPRVNRAIGRLLLAVYAGFGWSKLRGAHVEHHQHAGTARDPDFYAANPHHFWPWYGAFLRRYFGWQAMAYVWAVVLLYFFVLKVPPLNIFLLYGLPAIASSLQLFYFGTYRPHRHQSEPFVDGHRSRSNDYGTLASLLSCFHFGYHHVHHVAPSVPWWRLPQRHAQWLQARRQAQ